MQFDVEVSTLAWALISFNLALALAAVPAAALARRRPVGVFRVSTVVFAAASFACAFSPTFGVLVGLRAVQGVAGAAVVVAALDLLSEVTGADASAARIWALAGIVGASVGPAIGGILTQLFGWESIFVLQAPVALLGLLALSRRAGAARARAGGAAADRSERGAPARLGRPRGRALPARDPADQRLAARTARGGARRDDHAVAAIAATRLAGGIRPPWTRAASGAILISGGLAALAWLPHAGVVWTILPQIAIGAGLGLALSALTSARWRAALGRRSTAAGRSPRDTPGSCSDCSC